jgi:hypothetical protein
MSPYKKNFMATICSSVEMNISGKIYEIIDSFYFTKVEIGEKRV